MPDKLDELGGIEEAKKHAMAACHQHPRACMFVEALIERVERLEKELVEAKGHVPAPQQDEVFVRCPKCLDSFIDLKSFERHRIQAHDNPEPRIEAQQAEDDPYKRVFGLDSKAEEPVPFSGEHWAQPSPMFGANMDIVSSFKRDLDLRDRILKLEGK